MLALGRKNDWKPIPIIKQLKKCDQISETLFFSICLVFRLWPLRNNTPQFTTVQREYNCFGGCNVHNFTISIHREMKNIERNWSKHVKCHVDDPIEKYLKTIRGKIKRAACFMPSKKARQQARIYFFFSRMVSMNTVTKLSKLTRNKERLCIDVCKQKKRRKIARPMEIGHFTHLKVSIRRTWICILSFCLMLSAAANHFNCCVIAIVAAFPKRHIIAWILIW